MQGRLSGHRIGNLAPSTYIYDARGRVANITTGTGATARTVTLTYDDRDRLVSTLDPMGRLSALTYDTADRVVTATTPGLHEIGFSYDPAGNILSIAPPGRPSHGQTYTPVHLQDGYLPPSTGDGAWNTAWGYNLDRQITSEARPDGITMSRTHDAGGRLTSITHAGGSRSFEYEGSRGAIRRSVSEDGVTMDHTYDGTLPISTTWSGPVSGTVSRQYNADLRIATETVATPSGPSLPATITYNTDGAPSMVSGNLASGILILGYDSGNGLLDFLRVWNADELRTYNEFGERSSDQHIYNSSFSRVDLSNVYTRDSLGRITRQVEAVQGVTRTLDYTYDLDGRLERVTTNGNVTAVYQYDSNGNRLSAERPSETLTGSYDAQDRLLSYGPWRYTYTRNGDLLTKTDTRDGAVTRYTYDVYGALKRVELPEGRVIEYLTDAANRRVGKKVNGVLVRSWLYSSALTPAAELDGNGNVIWRIVLGQYLQQGNSNTYYRLLRDHRGSVRLVVHATNGQIAQRLDYDEFGRVTMDTNPGFQPFGFAGGLYDSDTGLVRFGARDYDPETGRWTSKDPIRFVGGQGNLYLYVDGDPVNRVDPQGTFALMAVGAAFGFVFEVSSQLASGTSLSNVDWQAVVSATVLGLVGGGISGAIGKIAASTAAKVAAQVAVAYDLSLLHLVIKKANNDRRNAQYKQCRYGTDIGMGDIGWSAVEALGGEGIGRVLFP